MIMSNLATFVFYKRINIMRKLGRIIRDISELMNNLCQVDAYLNDDNDENYANIVSLIAKGTNFVVYKSEGQYHFAPSRFVGYLNNDLLTHLVKKNGKNGRETSPAIDSIIGHTRAFNQKLEDEYLGFCDRLGITPKHMVNTQRKYWLLDNKQNKIYTEGYYEGSLQQALVNRYERNPIARKKCIEKHGCICQVCGMDFAKVYGELGIGFIHVHHIVPISTQKGINHKIDPENSLIPVCPNCHAMVHKGKLSIEELRKILGK